MTTVTIVTKQRPHGDTWRGAWAASIVTSAGRQVLTDIQPGATQQEAIMRGLLLVLEECSTVEVVEVRTNFKNLVDGMKDRMNEWRKSGWQTQANTHVRYEDLWRALGTESRRFPITWRFVPSNDGEIIELSEECARNFQGRS